MSADTGAMTPLKSLGWRLEGVRDRPSLSPDGQQIAYAARAVNPPTRPTAHDTADRHIFVLAANGSRETVLVKNAGLNVAPIWTPDGRHVLFLSNRSGTLDLWAASVADGTTSPSPLERNIGQQVSDQLQISWLGATGTGSYYYASQQPNLEQVLLFDLKDKRRQAQSFVGLRAAWSPNGKTLLFVGRDPKGTDTYDLVAHSLEAGEEQRYSRAGILPNLAPTWFHDGKSFLKLVGPSGGPNTGPNTLQRIDVSGGGFTEIPVREWTALGIDLQTAAISPDDRMLYLPAWEKSVPPRFDRIVEFDLAARQQRSVIMVPGGLSTFSLSPDGRTLAIASIQGAGRMSLSTLAVADGTPRHVYTYVNQRSTPGLSKVKWTADGRAILFAEWREPVWRVMRVPAEGGTPVFTGLEDANLKAFDPSPDGARLAFSTVGSRWETRALDINPSLLEASR